MYLTSLKVLEISDRLVRQGKKPLIENLCERELNNPEGVGLDLRFGEVYQLKGKGFLGIDERKTPKEEKIGDIKTDGNQLITLSPSDYFLVTTMETINCPAEKISIKWWMPKMYLVPIIYPRSNLQRCGVHLVRTKTDPGYSGKLTFGLANLGWNDFEFELGARMFNIVFETAIGDIKRKYEGQWNGGRVSTDGKTETQI